MPVVYDYNDGGVGKGFAFSIQEAIDDANEGDVLEASWGIYYENVTFGDESITLKSEHPEDPEVVAETVIDARYNKGLGTGNYIGAVVDFNEASGSSLAGFTLVDACGVGVICIDLSSAYVSSCIIEDNCWDGIFMKSSSVDLRDCEIRSNAADDVNDFSGIYCQSGCDVNIVNCVVADNDGNGICCHESNVLITNSTIYGNENSGIDFDSISAELRSNLIYGNGISGIDISNSSGAEPNVIVVNNTIVGNSDYGIYSAEANDVNAVNCIVYANGDDANDNLYAGDSETFDVTYSCIEGGYTGTGNISSAPCFFDDANDDYHLTWESPCVHSGDPNFVADANETDIDGNPRVMGGRVDMGADEDFPHCDPNYPDWVLLGRPNCWMTPYQCDGDASCLPYLTTGWLVYTDDLNILSANWKKKPDDETLNPCADVSHRQYLTTGWRVYTDDLSIVATNWKKKAGTPPTGLAGDCPNRGCEEGAMGAGGKAATELTAKEILEWLAEIWLDPEVQKAIDEAAWRRLVESLKEEWEAGI